MSPEFKPTAATSSLTSPAPPPSKARCTTHASFASTYPPRLVSCYQVPLIIFLSGAFCSLFAYGNAGASAAAPPLPVAAPSSVWDFTAVQYGKEVPLSKYRGQVLVVVNVASE